MEPKNTTERTGKILAESCNAGWSSDPDFGDTSDIILVSVPDDEVEGVISNLICTDNTVIAHTAGSLGLEVCDPLSFKGRQGSGTSPERRTYADDGLPWAREVAENANQFTDFVMMNQYFGSWAGPAEGLAPALEKVGKMFPDRMVVISEFGLAGLFAPDTAQAMSSAVRS